MAIDDYAPVEAEGWMSEGLDKDYGYNYPLGMKLRPTDPLHARLVRLLTLRIEESFTVMSKRVPSWDAVDEMLTAYMPLSAFEKDIKKADRREPVSLVIPATFASLETYQTYLKAAFFSQQEIWHYTSRNPDSTVGAMLLDLVISAQAQRFQHVLPLSYSIRDGLAYGYGAVTPKWHSVMGRQRRPLKRTMTKLDGSQSLLGYSSSVEDVKLFEGNELFNIDPRRAFPDPGVPIHQPQRGEYWGFITRENRLTLLQREELGEDGLFNCRYLKNIRPTSRFNMGAGMRDTYGTEVLTAPMMSLSNRADVIWLYVRLVPKEWGLPGPDEPQIWLFALGGDQIILAAEPLDLDHAMIPVAVNAPDSDGYSNSPMGRLEITYGIQEFVNALVNMHISAKRTANNRYLLDPAIANIVDAEQTKEGGFIKIRKAMQGLGKIQEAMLPVPYQDVTMNNLNDMASMLGLMNNLMGTPEAMQGIMRNAPERLTASEARGTKASALSKMERIAQIISAQMFYPLGYMLASQTIQFMEDRTFVQIVGRFAQDLAKEFGIAPGATVAVDPHQLMIDFDVVISDGSIAGTGDAEVLAQMFQAISANPILANDFDMLRLAEGVFRAAGEKNVMDYIKKNPNPAPVQTQIMPDAQVQQQAQAGNIVPIGATNG